MTNPFMEALAKAHLVESDEAAPPDAAPTPVAPRPVPMPSFSAPAPTTSSGPVLTADDQARLKAIEAQVYATPSSYVIFQRVRETLGNPADLQSVFRVLTAANPGVTAAKVLADIDTHLGIIASKRSEFDAQIAQAKAARIDGPTQQIADLTRQNQEAQAQIADRTATVAQLTQTVHDAGKALEDGAARFKLIEDQLSAPLAQAKQLLSSLT